MEPLCCPAGRDATSRPSQSKARWPANLNQPEWERWRRNAAPSRRSFAPAWPRPPRDSPGSSGCRRHVRRDAASATSSCAPISQTPGVPDGRSIAISILVSGNQVTVRGEATGTPAGEFMGTPHTGKSFKLMSIDVHTLEGGQMVRSYHIEDWLGAVHQLSAK